MARLKRKQVLQLLSKQSPAIWHNEYSAKESLRLSKVGMMELKTSFKIYPIPMKPGFQVKNVHIKYLEEELIAPYYLDTKALVLFSPRDAMELKLTEGDLDSWSRARWINDKYQEPPKLPDEEY